MLRLNRVKSTKLLPYSVTNAAVSGLFVLSVFRTVNNLYIPIVFYLFVNLTCVTNEYLLNKYLENKEERTKRTARAAFVVGQLVYTLVLYLVFKIFFH